MKKHLLFAALVVYNGEDRARIPGRFWEMAFRVGNWGGNMVFSNLFFIYLFLPLNLLLYYVVKNRTWQNVVLLLFSLFFYTWSEPVWVFVLMLTAFLDFSWAKCIERCRMAGRQRGAKLALAASLVFDLGMLGVFKYSGFFVENLNAFTGLQLPVPQIALPIGISFYTFQTISYVLDVYRGQVPAQKTYYKYLMYLSSYHQLVAGPIVRYSDVAAEIDNRSVSPQDFSEGITRFCVGLCKKVVVANMAGQLVAQYMDGNLATLSVAGAWFGALVYTIQLYYDFSAYSDMAIGLGRMFGFHYHMNFNYPYISKSVTEFWRRWHISLSTFFRDYVYIPLGGNRRHQIFNLCVVWLLTGLWHGASWNFILWGAFYGVLLIVEKLGLLKILEKLPGILCHLYLLLITLVGWTLFYTTDLGRLKGYFAVMFGISGNPLTDAQLSINFLNHLFWLIAAVLFCMPITQLVKKRIDAVQNKALRAAGNMVTAMMNLGLLFVCTSMLVGDSYNPFLYFRF